MPTLEEIESKMIKLQAQAEALIAKRAQSVLGDIRKLMEEHGLTPADITAHIGAPKRRGRAAGAASKPATKRATVAKSAKTAAKGKMPAKYINRKTGETWSGHARPPAWIKNVKDRTKFLIDGTSAVADAGTSSTTKPVGKTGAASKKAAAKKVVTKKSETTKKGATKVTATAKKVPTRKATAAVKKTVASKKAATPAAKKAPGRETATAKTAAAKPDASPVSETVVSQAMA
jgi:DNA-binding protein H-NS